jgi:hypothetical protein
MLSAWVCIHVHGCSVWPAQTRACTPHPCTRAPTWDVAEQREQAVDEHVLVALLLLRKHAQGWQQHSQDKLADVGAPPLRGSVVFVLPWNTVRAGCRWHRMETDGTGWKLES